VIIRALIIASAVISTAGNILIWRDTWRWKDSDCRPVAASWAEWAALMGTGSAAAFQAGQLPAAVYGAFCAAGCAVVVPLALRIPAAERDAPARAGQSRLDLLLLPAVLAGLMLLVTPLTPVGHGWIRTLGPAVAVTVATDALAYLPVIAHAWRQPGSEPWTVYGLFGVGAACSLAAVALQGQMLDLTAAAYPLYLTGADLGVAALIVFRRPAPQPPPGPVALELTAAGWRPVPASRDWRRLTGACQAAQPSAPPDAGTPPGPCSTRSAPTGATPPAAAGHHRWTPGAAPRT
jgi:hypothetical protein